MISVKAQESAAAAAYLYLLLYGKVRFIQESAAAHEKGCVASVLYEHVCSVEKNKSNRHVTEKTD